MTLLMSGGLTIGVSAIVFLLITLILVGLLLFAKAKLVPSGNVSLKVNGEKDIETPIGGTLLGALQSGGIFLSSACGGGGKCGQCRAQVIDGGGEILPTEKGFFSRKQVKDHWRLACQCKVKEDMVVQVPDEVFGVKEWECEVISNKNVATFIKEFIVALPKGEHMDFIPGSYAQIKIPTYSMDYNKDIDKSLIGPEYLPAWEKFGLFGLKCKNDSPSIRAYSMANYPAEGDRIMLTVRIATPPFKPKPQVGFMDVMPGIASSYIFTLKPGDKVTMSGPYGDFHPIFDSKREMMWIGGGAGMAPLRAQIMHMTKTLHTTDRELHFFYGARALGEAFFLEDFWELEKEFPNFHFHLSLDRKDPVADAQGVKYYEGFAVNCIRDTYLKDHEAPEDCEYYLCGPPMLIKTVTDYLDSLLLHRPDALMEPEEVAAAFEELHTSGKVRYFGVSNQNTMQMELLSRYVSEPLMADQLQFGAAHASMIASGVEVNMTTPGSVDRDGSVLDYCRLHDITIQAWSPFQYGMIEGVFLNSDKFAVLNEKIREIAGKYGVSDTTIATAWILRHPAHMQVLSGTMNLQRLREICKACEITLTREEWYAIYMAAGHMLP